METKTRRQMCIAIKNSTSHSILPRYFKVFMSKIILIQSAWKSYQDEKDKRFKHINNIWNKTIDNIVSNTITVKRKSKKHKTIMKKIINIPYEMKKTIISNYLQEQLQDYVKHGERLKKSRKKTISESDLEVALNQQFSYVPNETTVMKMIKTAADLDAI